MNKMHRLDKIIKRLCQINNIQKNRIISFKNFSSENNSEDNVHNSENSKIDSKNQSTTEYLLSDIKEQKLDSKVEPTIQNLSGFAQSFQKFSALENRTNEEPETFVTLLRKSKLMDLGDFENREVIGRIFHVAENDLYIDFGWKFHCVCPRPMKNGELYVSGSIVQLKIKDLELSTRFLGATTDVTLSEADCILVKLLSSPMQSVKMQNVRTQNISL